MGIQKTETKDGSGNPHGVARPMTRREFVRSLPAVMRAVGVFVRDDVVLVAEVPTPLLLLDAVSYARANREMALVEASECKVAEDQNASLYVASQYDKYLEDPKAGLHLAKSLDVNLGARQQMAKQHSLSMDGGHAEVCQYIDYLINFGGPLIVVRNAASAELLDKVASRGDFEATESQLSEVADRVYLAAFENMDGIEEIEKGFLVEPTFLIVANSEEDGEVSFYATPALTAQARHTGRFAMGSVLTPMNLMDEIGMRVIHVAASQRAAELSGGLSAEDANAARRTALACRLSALGISGGQRLAIVDADPSAVNGGGTDINHTATLEEASVLVAS